MSIEWADPKAFPELEGEENLPGKMLREARLMHGFSKTQLARKLNEDWLKVSYMEGGVVEISEEDAKKLGDIFQVSHKVFLR